MIKRYTNLRLHYLLYFTICSRRTSDTGACSAPVQLHHDGVSDGQSRSASNVPSSASSQNGRCCSRYASPREFTENPYSTASQTRARQLLRWATIWPQ